MHSKKFESEKLAQIVALFFAYMMRTLVEHSKKMSFRDQATRN